MLMKRNTSHGGAATERRPWAALCLVGLLCLVMPATALADSGYEGPDTCAQCHAAEVNVWQESPHAQAMTRIEDLIEEGCTGDAPTGDCECLSCHTTGFDPTERAYAHEGVTCEACHGPYAPDHPQEGVMRLPIDASTCQGCHTETYQQWQATAHAASDVQCTSCHVSHSQATRLTSEELCGSCHREEAEDWAHHTADSHCEDCHISSASVQDAATDVRVGGRAAPNHSFELVVEPCTNCHGQSIHQQVLDEPTQKIDQAQVADTTARAQNLASELEEAKRTNRALQTTAVVSLGFGLGTGGVLGAILVIFVSYIGRGSEER